MVISVKRFAEWSDLFLISDKGVSTMKLRLSHNDEKFFHKAND